MMVVIPRRIKKKNIYYGGTMGGLLETIHHYEYVGTSRYVVIYRCLENGTLECFKKTDFLDKKGYDAYLELDPV